MSNTAVVEKLKKVFESQKKDNSGLLPFGEFKAILNNKTSNGISDRGAITSLIECPINDDGKVNYLDFLKNAVVILDNAAAAVPLKVSDGTPRAHIHGMIREDFLKMIVRKLKEYNVKGDVLNRNLIRSAFRDKEIGFSHREINYSMGFMEEHYENGHFDPNVVADTLWELLLAAHDENYLALPADETAVTQYLVELFQKADVEKKGEISPLVIQSVLSTSELGFNSLQINAILGLLGDLSVNYNYKDFTDYVAEWVVSWLHGRDLRDPSPQTLIAGMLRHDLTAYLLSECGKADPGKTGLIKYNDLTKFIAAPSFSPREQSGILSFVVANIHDPKGVPYQALVQNAYDVCWVQQKIGIDDV